VQSDPPVVDHGVMASVRPHVVPWVRDERVARLRDRSWGGPDQSSGVMLHALKPMILS